MVAASLALACCTLAPALAQPVDLPELDRRFNELQDAGRNAEALPVAQQILAAYDRMFAPDDPRLATPYYVFANFYRKLRRTNDAVALYKRALAIREKSEGPDAVGVGQVLVALGNTYGEDGSYAEAEPALKRAIAIAEKSGNPRLIAITLNNLAATYYEQYRFADAVPLAERALAYSTRVLKPDDPALATELDNLAQDYHQLGRDKEAEPLLGRALAISKNAVRRGGENRSSAWDLATALEPLAMLYRDQGRYADAEKLYQQALALKVKWFGPDNNTLAPTLNDLALLYRKQGRYADAEALDQQSLAISEKSFGPNALYTARALNGLTLTYDEQRRYADALPLVLKSIAHGSATTEAALPALFGAYAGGVITAGEALDDSLNVVQRANQSSTGDALKALAVRLSSGSDRLAELVRKDQDLASEAKGLDKQIVAAVSAAPSQRDAVAEQSIRNRIAVIAKQREQLGAVFAREFPDYAALSRPQPLTVKDIQPLLADDEALVVIALGARSYAWAITRSQAEWKELAGTADEISGQVSSLRALLDVAGSKPFDAKASFALYQKVLAPVEDLLRGKTRLSLVLNGALTSLPPQVLVTQDPAGKELKDVNWLVRQYAIAILPSVESLKVLRGKSAIAAAQKPLIGFADAVFNAAQPNARVAASITASRGIQGTVANVAALKAALPALPETADELTKVAAYVHAGQADVIVGRNATESRVKQSKLDQYRIVYFATHGLLAGEVANFAKLNAEPALVLSLPDKPDELDDGLLTASEVAQLKLNAEWVVLSACNTASGDKPGAEALSGLARAFFYAGSRSLLVSNWVVETDSTVALMTGTFAALADNPRLSHAEALQKSMLAMIGSTQHPEWADPKYWASFVVVGEPAKPR
jgi:CHAT domain-containing protein